jgi:acid phosphatase
MATSYPLYAATGPVKDAELTVPCDSARPAELGRGDYAVKTIQPAYHHQPFNYFEAYAPGTDARRQHLRDEVEFEALAGASRRRCRLEPVSFVKPIGAENEHPGYASEHAGSEHLVDLLRTLQRSRCARDTMVVVTYDEFGGQWDHVPPPGQGPATPGPHDEMGPGSRVPALTIAPGLRRPFSVDRASHDSTSIMATIERRFGLRPVTARDAQVQDLSTVFGRRGHGGRR